MIRRLLACLSLSFVLGPSIPALCANSHQSQPVSRITEPINDNLRVVLKGSVHPLAQPQNDMGAVMPSMPMDRMLLVLKRSAAQDKALAAAIKEMARPGSKTFHQWMTAEQIGAQYGVSQDDVNTVTAWLARNGFTVSSVSKARGEIEFSGSAQQVSSTFHTEIHSYLWKGKTYTANVKDPEIPAALTPVVAGFVSLNNFPIKGAHADSKVVMLDKSTKTWSVVADKGASGAAKVTQAGETQAARPDLTTNQTTSGNTIYAVTPYDLATIYNLTPLWNAGLDGTGQQIAIVAESDIQISDVTQFRKAFGLPATHVNVIDNGPPAGLQADSDQQEAEIDVEWAGAVAKNATIDLVSTASTPLTTGLYLSMTYAVDNAVAPVLEVSYDYCEFTMGVAGNLFMYQTWQQAAAEGITVVVAAGDTGSADCDNYIPLDGTNGMGVSAFASTPYDVAVGGTDFYASYTNPSEYWSATNDPTTRASALSYVPEISWNASCAGPEVFSTFGAGSGSSTPLQWCDNPNIPAIYLAAQGGGGGPSTCSSFNLADFPKPSYCAAGYPKPDWQAGVNGIPSDGARDVPDVSLFSSDLTFNSAYLYCLTDPVKVPSCNFSNSGDLTYEVAGGTSFAAPAFAGMVALVNQKTNSTQGLANYYLYSMAAQEFGSTATPNDSQTLSCNSGSNQGGSNTCTFYDVTVGNIQQPCTVGSPECIPGPNYLAGITPGYSANPGYDLATGLGSVNATNLVNNWAALTAAKQPTAITLSASSLSSSYGQPITLSGSVTPLSGSGTPPGSVAIEGLISGAQVNQASIPVVNGYYSEAVQNLLPGSYAVTANYAGDGGYQNSVSQPVSMVVAAATATSTIAFTSQDNRSLGTLPSSNGQIPYGNNVVTTVTVQSPVTATAANGVLAPTGSVTFSSNGKALATVPLSGNFAVYTTAASQPLGSYSITAAYSGDQNYNSAGPVTQSYTVVQDGTSIEAHANASIMAPGTPVTLTATVVSNSHFTKPTGSVTFSLNGTAVGTVPAIPGQDPITLTGFDSATLVVPASQIAAGNNVVIATYSGDTNYLASTSVPSTFVSINGSQSTQMTMTASTTTATNLTPVTIQAVLTVNGAPVTQGTVNFMDNGKSIAQVQVVGLNPSAGAVSGTATLVKRLPVGTHEIVGIYSGAGNLIHPFGNGLPPITVTGEQITNTILSATSDVGTPANYDVTASVVAGGLTAPTGTLTLEETSLSVPLNSAVLTPGTEVVGLTPSTSSTGSQNSAIVVGDFNGDGILDYAATSVSLPTQLMVYLGNGDGSFKPGIGSVATDDPTLLPFTAMATADFNGDGILDIVFGNVNSNTYGGTQAIMMLGNGDGTFRQGQPLSVPAVAGGLTSMIGNIVTGDFNSDGIPDIAFSNYGLENDASVEVFFGVGDGTFTNTPTILANVGSASATTSTIYLTTGDVNKDGNADLVAFDSIDATATVFLGNGDGTFQTGVVYASGNFPEMGALGDVNGDGWPDMVIPNLVAASGTGSFVSVFLNNGDGTFGAPSTYISNFPNQVVLADLNNDGILDIVQAEDNGGHVAVMYGSASGSYSLSQFAQTTVNVAGAWQLALIDSKNSGYPDILVDEEHASSVGVLLNGMVSTAQLNNVALIGSAADSEILSANYSGDNASLASTAPSLMLSGSNATIPTKLSWSPGSNSTIFGTVVPPSVLNAQVANSVPGTITYVAQSTTAAIIPVSSGTILPAAGAYSITATFAPTSPTDYAQSTASTVFNVAKAGVTETLTSSAAQAAPGASIALTDTVVSNTTGTPTGSVSFLAGSLALGTSTISSTGIATITTTSLPVGTSSITAIYAGDSNFNSDTAAAISISIGSPSIALTVGQPTMTITAGTTGTETLTVTPQLGYTGDVSFTCGSLPVGVTCSFSPSSGAIGAAPLQSTLTVAAGAPSTTASAQNKSGAGMIAAGTAASLASILMIWLPGRRKRMRWAVLLLIAGISAFSIGCGGSGSAKTTTVTGPTASTLALTSSATKIASGGTVTFTSTLTGTNAASATGSIVFYDGRTQIGQANIASGSAQLTLNSLSVGIHTITASYAGDTLNEASNTGTGVEQAVTGQTFFTVIAASGNVSQSSVVSLTLQ
jgi:subtilase family serine protease